MNGWMDGWITMKVKMRSLKIQTIPPTNNFNFFKFTIAVMLLYATFKALNSNILFSAIM